MHKKVIYLILLMLISSFCLAQNEYDFSSWESNFTVLGDNPFDAFPTSVMSADFNGDGFDDIVMGAYYADPNGRNAAGTVYVIFGESPATQNVEIDLSASNADIQIFGANPNDQLGKAIAVGDINGDGYDDIIVSAPYASEPGRESCGKVYVILGGLGLLNSYDLLNEEYDSVIIGQNTNDYLGISLDCGDINNDNYEDIFISAPNGDYQSINNCGKVYSIFGNNTLNGEYDLSSFQPNLIFIGNELNDNAGKFIRVGNFNNDQFDDLAIGAPNADPLGRSNAGIIYLIEGRVNFSNSTILLSEDSDSKIFGVTSNGLVGNTLAFGDINGDNNDDLILSNVADNSGKVGVLFGSNNLPEIFDLSTMDLNVNIIGGVSNGILGENVYSAKVNQDNFYDIVIASPSADNMNGVDAGMVFVIYGSSDVLDQNLDDIPAPITLFGASADDKLGSSFCGLNINNDSRDDISVGAIDASNNRGRLYTIYGDLPFISDENPAPDQQDVAVDTQVSFSLYDYEDGIALNSIEVNIGGTNYNFASAEFVQSEIENGYNIAIIPSESFGYDQIVDVTVQCNDLSGWQMPIENYRFFTREDTDPPYTALWDPEPDELGVDIDTDVNFHIYDAGQGVDISSVLVNVAGVDYFLGTDGFSYAGSSEEYFITISPEENFAFNQVVPVTINATDIGENPNVMPEFSYEFTCGADNSPPQVILWDPSNNQEVSRIYPLTVQIIDPETGINQNSIEFYLDDVEITMDCNISLISNGYNIQYIPDSAHYHSYGTHQMRIVCSDNSSNLLDDSSSFICVEDTDPPFTENHYPAQFADDVPTNTNFRIDIRDLVMGVDENSISILVDGIEIIGLPQTNVSNIPNGYRISYQPANRLLGEIPVVVNCADLETPAHVMQEEVYSFTCVEDDELPYLQNLNPNENQTDVATDTNIYLEIMDNKTGVDFESIELFVDGQDVTDLLTIVSITNGASVLYNPENDFDYISEVNVQVSAADLAIQPNSINENYTFTTMNDIYPPYVNNTDPAPDEQGVALNRNIYLEIHDDELGVNENTIQMLINGEIIQPQITDIGEDNFALLYNPAENFSYSEQVTVTIFADDNAIPYNSLSNYSYSFTCVDDDDSPPFIRGLNPAASAINVDVESKISFELLDAATGVDLDTFIFRVNNIIIDDYYAEALAYADTTGFLIEYTPPNPFQYHETVNVQIYVRDLSSNLNEFVYSYYFTCIADEEPPQLIEAYPIEEGFENSSFYFLVYDEQSGVDISSLILRLDDELIDNELIQTEEMEDGTWEITYEPENNLQANDDFSVELQIDDNLGNHASYSYSIVIVEDTFSPRINLLTPEEGSFDLSMGDVMTLDILDKGLGISQTSIELKINGLVRDNYSLQVNPYGLNPDSLGYRLYYVFENDYYQGQYIHVNVYAEDLVQPANSTNETFKFHLGKEELDKVEVIPSILSLNNDGINDECKIWITSEKDITGLLTKIYDRKGRLITSLTTEHLQGDIYYSTWDGRDSYNYQISSGMYIFKIEIDGKAYQGSIVVAK